MGDRRTSSFCSSKAVRALEPQCLSPLPQRTLPWWTPSLGPLSFRTQKLGRAQHGLCKCPVRYSWIVIVAMAPRDCFQTFSQCSDNETKPREGKRFVEIAQQVEWQSKTDRLQLFYVTGAGLFRISGQTSGGPFPVHQPSGKLYRQPFMGHSSYSFGLSSEVSSSERLPLRSSSGATPLPHHILSQPLFSCPQELWSYPS